MLVFLSPINDNVLDSDLSNYEIEISNVELSSVDDSDIEVEVSNVANFAETDSEIEAYYKNELDSEVETTSEIIYNDNKIIFKILINIYLLLFLIYIFNNIYIYLKLLLI